MSEQEKEFLKVIELLSDHGCLKHVVLIGSWAEFLYQHAGIIPKGTTVLRTLDIDFLVKNLREPKPPVNLETLARREGFVVDNHPILGTTKIRLASRLEIEFLVVQKSAGKESVYRTALGVTAQALRGLDLLLHETISIDFMDINVIVPIPEAYVLHKIIINEDRNKIEKREKDKNTILAFLPYINKEKYYELLEQRTKKQRKKIDEFWAANPLPSIIHE